MVIGERIEGRLAHLGMSQAELGRRVGLHQSTINGLIRNGGSSRYLHRIAAELRTTAAYLSGETDDPKAELPDFALTATERADVEMTRLLPEEDRKLVHSLIARLAECAKLNSDGRTLQEDPLEFRAAS